MIDDWKEHRLVNERAAEVIDSLNARREVRLVIQYCFDTGGKRTRPLILLLSNSVAGGDVRKALDAAVAIEFVHNASLLHDDILDRGLMRRGQGTAYQRFGYKPALLSGDLLITMAIDLMVDSYGAQYVKRINDVVKDIINGEVMDVTSDEDTTIQEYEDCIESKTAKLFGAAAVIGGELADSPHADALERYSVAGGKAYQLVDDLLEFLHVQRDKRALESSVTMPEIVMRDRGVDQKEATTTTIRHINELVDEAVAELAVFDPSEDRARLEDLVRYMTHGVLEKSGSAVEGETLTEIMARA